MGESISGCVPLVGCCRGGDAQQGLSSRMSNARIHTLRPASWPVVPLATTRLLTRHTRGAVVKRTGDVVGRHQNGVPFAGELSEEGDRTSQANDAAAHARRASGPQPGGARRSDTCAAPRSASAS